MKVKVLFPNNSSIKDSCEAGGVAETDRSIEVPLTLANLA